MGGKITIDSASLANKGLEVIEAVHLFGIPPEKVTVLVHPQSVVHSLIRLLDGSMYAQMSYPDIRSPIQSALHWPDCSASDFGRFSLENLTLSFEKPDSAAFPMLGLAYQAVGRSGRYPTAYNAANEVAVEAFMVGKIGFLDISRLTQSVLESDWTDGESNLEAIIDADGRARALAKSTIGELR
jgi:1-deoxy-D-xylulose-5-phosphate reductoisomerase